MVMRKFLVNNSIVLIMGTALIVSMIMAIRNNFIIKENEALLKQTELVKERTKEILSRTMHGLDLGVRGYSLTLEDNMLTPYREAVEKNESTFKELGTQLAEQGYPSLDKLSTLKTEVQSYIAYCDQMIKVAQDSTPQLIAMLKEDRGYGVWKKYDEFSRPLFAFEDNLHQKAMADYNAAILNNLILQITIVLLGLPALFLFISRIHKERQARQRLLHNMEENDRHYVFNPGDDKHATPDEVINTSIRNVRQASDFIKGIANGDYGVSWEGITEKNRIVNEETLAGNLLHLREQLRKVKVADDQRNWLNEGLAQFSELVRNHQSNSEQLADRCVSFLTKHLKAQQGSLFVVTDEGDAQHLKLASCFAFDKKKFVTKEIDIGSGLVGQAFLEGEFVQLKQIPQGYTKITSGLGEATPNHLVIVPLKYDMKTVAILEIASFNVFADHEIEFLKKAGEFLASAILSTQTTNKMSQLLEQSRINEEGMRQREEEMRQNMEELQATQEELVRKEKEMQRHLQDARSFR